MWWRVRPFWLVSSPERWALVPEWRRRRRSAHRAHRTARAAAREGPGDPAARAGAARRTTAPAAVTTTVRVTTVPVGPVDPVGMTTVRATTAPVDRVDPVATTTTAGRSTTGHLAGIPSDRRRSRPVCSIGRPHATAIRPGVGAPARATSRAGRTPGPDLRGGLRSHGSTGRMCATHGASGGVHSGSPHTDSALNVSSCA